MDNNIELVKSNFIDIIKKWVILDKNLKIVNEKTKNIRIMKQETTAEILSYLGNDNENIKKHNIKINNDEVLRFYEKKDYSPLTFTYIETCLIDIIDDESQIEFIMDYLRTNRQITSSIDIRRITKNNENNDV